MTLTVDACATLPEVKVKDIDWGVRGDAKDKAKREKNAAEEEAEKAFQELMRVHPAPGLGDNQDTIDQRKKDWLESANKAEKAREKYEQLSAGEKQKDEKVRPNAFVTVTLDEDQQNGQPIAFTKTYRSDKRPFWHESFGDLPLGLLAHGKWADQVLRNGMNQTFCPTRLNFWIYHDIGEDQEKKNDSWKRDSPKRDLAIGRACLNFGSLMCNGNDTWHELPVLDMHENPIHDCKLRVRTKIDSADLPHKAVIVQSPLSLPGGLVCGKAQEPVCSCGNDCGSVCVVGSSPAFSKPAKKHKYCKAKKRKCRKECCVHWA